MQTELRRVVQNRRDRPRLSDPGVWTSLLLAGSCLLVGALYQETVQFGWLAAAAALMLLVRLGLPFRSAQPASAPAAERLPAASASAWLWGAAGAGLLGLLFWLLPLPALTMGWALAGLALIGLGRDYPLRFAGSIGLLLAAGHLALFDSFRPEVGRLALGGLVLEGDLQRQLGSALACLLLFAGLWAYRTGPGERAVRGGLAIAAHLLLLWVITYEVADAIEITRGAASMGNEALLVAAAWGLYALMLVATAPLVEPGLPWLAVGQSLLSVAIAFLLMGGLMAQGRWADPAVRMVAYAAVPGAAVLAGWLQWRRGRLDDPDRLLALAGAAMGFGIVSFETLRWLEPIFAYPAEVHVTPAMLARDGNVQSLWSLGLWGAYSLLLWGVGGWIDSRAVRFLALSLLVSAGLYGLGWMLL